MIAMLDRFEMDLADPSWPLNQLISAMLVLFRPQIVQLVRDRDRAIETWQGLHPERDAYEDRELEVTSSLPISLEQQLRWLDEIATARDSTVNSKSGRPADGPGHPI
jgi:hypothetical protein